MTFFKKNIAKIVFIFIILLVIGFLFYWFQYRSIKIRKECNREASYYSGTGRGLYGDTYDVAYKKCLREKGAK